jgi:glyoxylase-like metal-dependent hydrolase (beta-lactamase superfamily II)
MMKSEVIGAGIVRVPTGISNAYFLGSPGHWILVDTGTPGNVSNIRKAAARHFGMRSRPLAIVLTHGHFDHAGSARTLAEDWRVSIYAHRLEFPFLDGTTAYPPPDPTVGGFMAQAIRFIPNKKMDVGPSLQELRPGALPWLSEWEVLETPGHTAGHISLFRSHDQSLLAGDAFVTVNQDSAFATIRQEQEVSRPPAYYTSDWEAARDSVQRLAKLNPMLLAAGHGVPMSGHEALEQLQQLAQDFPVPDYGRYVDEPARSDETGITFLPPPVADPVKRAAIVGGAVVTGLAAGSLVMRRARKKQAALLSAA